MAARKSIPDTHHVMRYVPPAKRYVDPDGNRLGPSLAAFKLRDTDDGGLSVTEVEHYGAMGRIARAAGVEAHRQTLDSKTLSKNAIFAWAEVKDIKAAGRDFDKKVRVIHDPVDGNPGHAEIRHFSDDDLALLEHLAERVFVDYETVQQITADQSIS